MTSPEGFNLLIVTDSRGANMRQYLQEALVGQYTPDMTLHVETITSQDGTLKNLVSLAENNKISDGTKFDFLYLFGGSEELLFTEDNKSRCVYKWVGSLVDNMCDKLYLVRNQLFEIAHRPVICELIGIDMSKCDNVSPTVR